RRSWSPSTGTQPIRTRAALRLGSSSVAEMDKRTRSRRTRGARHQPMAAPESPGRGAGPFGKGRRRLHIGAADVVNALRRLDEFRNTSVRLIYDLVDQATNGFAPEKMPDH